MNAIDPLRFTPEDAPHAHHVSLSSAGAGEGRLYCIEDDYTDPWQNADTVIMLHGIAERAETWRGWVPHLSRTYKVLRPDLRGFGRSSALPSRFTIADWADDIVQLVEKLERPRVHLVATKLGALIAFELAQRQLPWIQSLTLAGMLPSPSKALGPWIEEWLALVENAGSENGVERWARETMPGRMGSALSPAATSWWTQAMATAPAATVAACFRLLPGIEGPPHPERVRCPTLFVAAGAPVHEGNGTYNQRPAPADLLRLKDRVAHARWAEVPADSYHIAATHPDACARLARDFIDEVSK